MEQKASRRGRCGGPARSRHGRLSSSDERLTRLEEAVPDTFVPVGAAWPGCRCGRADCGRPPDGCRTTHAVPYHRRVTTRRTLTDLMDEVSGRNRDWSSPQDLGFDRVTVA